MAVFHVLIQIHILKALKWIIFHSLSKILSNNLESVIQCDVQYKLWPCDSLGLLFSKSHIVSLFHCIKPVPAFVQTTTLVCYHAPHKSSSVELLNVLLKRMLTMLKVTLVLSSRWLHWKKPKIWANDKGSS